MTKRICLRTLRELHAGGMCDDELATHFGMTTGGIRYYRGLLRLPCNRKPCKRKPRQNRRRLMGTLTGPEIKRLATEATNPNGQRIVLDPFDPECVGPASYDLHLGNELREYRVRVRDGITDPIDPKNPPESRLVPWSEVGYGPFWQLEPGRVYLASTREYTETHGLAAQVAGRSSWGRYGLFVHVTAGFIDPGFCGRITLELVATQPVLVRPGDRIAQIVYTTITGEYQPYRGRYQGDTGPTASRYHLPVNPQQGG